MSFLDLSNQIVESVGHLNLPPCCESLDVFDFTIDISNNSLDTLGSHDAIPQDILDVFNQCEVLITEGNLLSDFCGVADVFPNLVVIDASANYITDLSVDSLDALSCLPYLDTIILGRNQMNRFIIGSIRGGPVAPIATQLKVIDLSDNMLTRFPDFSQCISMTTVVLTGNNIMQLDDQKFGKHLPPKIEALQVDSNKIDDWWALVQLSTVADTLKHFSVKGNIFCDQVKFSWRIFIGWLVPNISTIDGEELTTYEIDATSDIFKDDHVQGGALSISLLALMDTGREVELEEYLSKNCRVHPRSSHLHRTSVSSSVSYDDNPEGVSPSLDRSLVKSPRNGSKKPMNGTSVNMPQNTPIIGAVQRQTSFPKYVDPVISTVSSTQFISMAKKIKVIQEIVKVLRQQDMCRRKYASIVIQKYWRGFLCRKYKMTSGDLRKIKLAKSRANKRAKSDALNGVSINGSVSKIDIKGPTSYSNGSSFSPTQQQFDKLESTLMSLVVQVQSYSPVINAIRIKSAKTIQTYYRSYRARKGYKLMKEAYRRYTARYQAPVIKMQSMVRMFLQRKKFLREITKVREMNNLKGTVKVLGGKLSAMERAMEELIGRLQVMEQLTLIATDSDG